MRKTSIIFIVLMLFFFVNILCQENPTESSNLYDRMGVIAERGLHGAVPEENIDLFSGSLVLRYLDITLPGPNGFDLNVWRVYNSKVETEWTTTTYSYPQQETSSWVGYGWSMHMGRLLNPDTLIPMPTIEFPDGRREATFQWKDDTSILVTQGFLHLKRYNPDFDNHHTLHFKDGTVWVFGARTTIHIKGADVDADLVTRIVNRYGHTIVIEYYGDTPKLKKITDALGREVLFNLDGNGNLDSMTVPHADGSVIYEYTVIHPAWNDVAYTRLESMKPPVLDEVSYNYNETTKELNRVDTSYGGTINYFFSDQDFNYFDAILYTRALIGKTVQFGSGNSSTWEYEYGDYSGDTWITIYVGDNEKQVNAGYTKVTGPMSVEHVWFFGPEDDVDEAWRAGIMAYTATYDSMETDMLAYSQQATEAEEISDQHIYVRERDWGTAKGVLQTGGYQAKIGDCGQYTSVEYDNAQLRKFGLPSEMYVAAPYQVQAMVSKFPQDSSTISVVDQSAAGKFTRNKFSFYKGSKDNVKMVANLGKSKAQSIELPTTFYWRYGKYFAYAFTDEATYPDFKNRYLLDFLTNENEFDPDFNALKGTLTEYFVDVNNGSNAAIKKIRRWKGGTILLDWAYTYDESDTEGPKEITITIDPPGAVSGIETLVYKNGTLARKEKPGFVEFDREIHLDGLIHTETNQHGGTMTFTYDDIGRITNIAMPPGFNPINAAWSQNSVAITRGGNTLTKFWDGMGRNLGFEEVGAGVTLHSRRTLDGEGRVVAESKGAINIGHKTVFELNANGQPLQLTDPTGKWTKFAYADNACTITDMKNNQKVLTYAHLQGLVTRVVQEDTQTDSYFLGENRLYLVESAVPGLGTRSQIYSQNGLDQLVHEYHPETGTIDYLYNDEGNLASKAWGGATISYTYNASNQLKTESDGEETIIFNYDPNGRVHEITSSNSQWRRYDISYNTLGAITSEKQIIDDGLIVLDKNVGYHYDGNGLLDEITYPDGRKAAYGNNALLLPESLAFNSEANRVSGVTYGVNKQPLGYTLGNGASFAASYDPAGRIQASGINFGGSPLLAATYCYDDVGNIASLTNTTPAANASFQYDAFNRLTKATYPEKIYDYAYDSFGNMLSAQENSVIVFNKTYNAGNRISDCSYDNRGNLTQDGSFIQVWDKRNRMTESRTAADLLLGSFTCNERGLRVKALRYGQSSVQVVAPNGGENLYLGALDTISWDGMGLGSGLMKLELLVGGAVAGTIAENLPGTQTSCQWQVGKTLEGWVNPGSDYKIRVTAMVPPAASGTTYYFYDSGGRLLSEYDGTGTCVRDYLYLGGKMIGEYVPFSSMYYYYGSDQINSTRLVTDSAGAVVHSAQYDPYGGLYKTWVDAYHPKPGFSGKEREFGSEMDYFGARYYGHKQYRFLSVDPILNKGESSINPQLLNLYSYSRNNPIGYLEHGGLASFKVNSTLKFVGIFGLSFNWGQYYIDRNVDKALHFSAKTVNGKVQIDVTLNATIKVLDPFNYSLIWLSFGGLGKEKPRDTILHELGHESDIISFATEKINILENLINQGMIKNDTGTIKSYLMKIIVKATEYSRNKRDLPNLRQNEKIGDEDERKNK